MDSLSKDLERLLTSGEWGSPLTTRFSSMAVGPTPTQPRPKLPSVRTKDITGIRRNMLVAERFIGKAERGRSIWLFRCDCGGTKVMRTHAFLNDDAKSCGCARSRMIGAALSARQTTHGLSTHKGYPVWNSMVQRCKTPQHPAYHNYGARGISVCDSWRTFAGFWADMGPSYVEGLTIERVDVNGNYHKGNCVWDTRTAQARNKRGNVVVNSPWGRMTAAEAADRAGIGRTTVYYRISHGWPESRLFDPPDSRNRP